LTEVVQKYKVSTDNIYNVHETGMIAEPKGNFYIVCLREIRQIGAVSSAETDGTVTMKMTVPSCCRHLHAPNFL
jgi:hypothetical protein